MHTKLDKYSCGASVCVPLNRAVHLLMVILSLYSQRELQSHTTLGICRRTLMNTPVELLYVSQPCSALANGHTEFVKSKKTAIPHYIRNMQTNLDGLQTQLVLLS